jgi:cytoskeletal protein RodZ
MTSPGFGAFAPRSRGSRLAALRQQRGLSLEQIAETTKISLRFLRAIEAEQIEELPGGIFRTSYLKQYARCVNCDEAELLARFSEKLDSDGLHEAGLAESEDATPRKLPTRAGNSLRRWFRR